MKTGIGISSIHHLIWQSLFRLKQVNCWNVLEELADVTNYCLQMAQVLGVDIIDVVNKKMDITEKKYPVEKAKGVSTKYDKL